MWSDIQHTLPFLNQSELNCESINFRVYLLLFFISISVLRFKVWLFIIIEICFFTFHKEWREKAGSPSLCCCWCGTNRYERLFQQFFLTLSIVCVWWLSVIWTIHAVSDVTGILIHISICFLHLIEVSVDTIILPEFLSTCITAELTVFSWYIISIFLQKYHVLYNALHQELLFWIFSALSPFCVKFLVSLYSTLGIERISSWLFSPSLSWMEKVLMEEITYLYWEIWTFINCHC